ncbi:MAG: amino acid adenylation domain-containing protein, partial [bacterium]|nr:amino acid adenylation domain-containing protein [bacterium]
MIKIGEIEILSEKEKRQILYEFNDTAGEYPAGKTIHRLFEEQVEGTPHHMAVTGKMGTGLNTAVTYRELNESAKRTAALLREKNIRPGQIVAIMARRSIELIAGIMGILKAGGAYLPLNPSLPSKRIRYMLEDSNAKILLRKFEELNELNEFEELREIEEVDLTGLIRGRGNNKSESEEDSEEKETGTRPRTNHRTSNPAYIIYTSGTTGRPKGVMVQHRALVNFLYGMNRTFDSDITGRDKCLSLTAITFDVSVAEIFLPMTFGAALDMMEDEQIFDVDKLAEKLVERAITFAYIPPALLKRVNERLSSQPGKVALNKLLVGVEAITDEQLE